jgi:predicted permease
VLIFVALVTVFAGVFSGLVAALRATRVDVSATLKEEGRGATSLRMGRLSKGIVVFEVALSGLLLVLAGLMTKSIIKLRYIDLGIQQEQRLTARIGLFDAAYPTEADKARFFERLLEGLGHQSAVVRAAVTSALPTFGSDRDSFELEGQSYPTEQDKPRACTVSVSPGYFATLGLKPIAGREFERLDNSDSEPVALVNQTFVNKFWKGRNAIGRRIRLVQSDGQSRWRTVVGVIRDLKEGGLDHESHTEAIYLPLAQHPQPFMSLLVQTRTEPLAQTALVRRQIAAIDPNLPIYWVYTLPRVIHNSSFFQRLFGTLFMIFGVAALVLAAVGIYGVLAFSVSQRTQEIGVRMALGAQTRNVLALILRQGSIQVAAGLVLGLGAGMGASRLLAVMLYDVQPGDPAVFALTALTLSTVALIACYVPARRASRIDPMIALRYE